MRFAGTCWLLVNKISELRNMLGLLANKAEEKP